MGCKHMIKCDQWFVLIVCVCYMFILGKEIIYVVNSYSNRTNYFQPSAIKSSNSLNNKKIEQTRAALIDGKINYSFPIKTLLNNK